MQFCHPSRGVTLVHKGSNVTNIVACNAVAGLTGLKQYKLKVEDPETKKVYEVGNYSTVLSKQKYSLFPDSVYMLLGRGKLIHDESHERYQSVADGLKLDINDIIPY